MSAGNGTRPGSGRVASTRSASGEGPVSGGDHLVGSKTGAAGAVSEDALPGVSAAGAGWGVVAGAGAPEEHPSAAATLRAIAMAVIP
jgi:hypothetical protein